MATYLQIGSTVTVGSGGAATIDFTSIPSTYTDLLVRLSLRTNVSGAIWDDVSLSINGSTASFSGIWVQGTGSGVGNGFPSPGNVVATVNGSTATSSTFASVDLYLPNYASSNNKSWSTDSVTENNATAAFAMLWAGLRSNTAAVTSLSFAPVNGTLFTQYSTASLYGIKKD
jgi:hypothetical protein